MKTRSLVAAAVLSLAWSAAHADDAHHKGAAKVAQASSQLAEGEVRKVDKDARKITLRHGPIQNLDMPAMSMVFQVKDPAMLDQVKTGDKVRFQADKVNGQFTVTHIEPAK